MNEGYIKLHRKIWDSWIATKRPEWFYAWLWLLTEAAYKPTHKFIKDTKITLQTGEVANTLSYYAKAFNRISRTDTWTIHGVRHFFEMLQKHGMIERKSTNSTTIVTICNYDSYQENQTKSRKGTANEPLKSRKENRKVNRKPNDYEKQQLKYQQPQTEPQTEPQTNPKKAATKYKRKEINNRGEKIKEFDEAGFCARVAQEGASMHLESIRHIIEAYNQTVGQNSAVLPKFFKSIPQIADHLKNGTSPKDVWQAVHGALIEHKERDKFLRSITSENLIPSTSDPDEFERLRKVSKKHKT